MVVTRYTSLAETWTNKIMYIHHYYVFYLSNSGSSDYWLWAGSGWGNVTGGHKASSKMLLLVGNLDYISDLVLII